MVPRGLLMASCPQTQHLSPARGQSHPWALGPCSPHFRGAGSISLTSLYLLATFPTLHLSCLLPLNMLRSCSLTEKQEDTTLLKAHFSTFPQPGARSPPIKARVLQRVAWNPLLSTSTLLQAGSVPTTALTLFLLRSLTASCGHF